MKYFVLGLFIFIMLFIIIFKRSVKKTAIINATRNLPIQDTTTNKNPEFIVQLIEYRKNQLNIYKSLTGDSVSFQKYGDGRIKVTNKRSRKCIGLIAKKDCQQFQLISKYPSYFEGKIILKSKKNNTLDQLTISMQLKKEKSKKVYLADKTNLYKLVSLYSLFEENENIVTNYGPSTVKSIQKNHLVIEVPSLGTREIYDIDNVKINN